mgnify:FL=1
MIYFDNSASTLLKPKNVQRAVLSALTTFSANPGRSGHIEALKSAMEVEKVREKLKKYTNADEVIFTGGCTHALNLAILGFCREGHIVCSENEHNSVLRPLEHLKENYNVTYSVAKQANKKGITWQDIEKEIKNDTKLVICNHISNVNGDVAEIEDIGYHLKEKGIAFLVDGAQGGGHFRYDMKKMEIDMLIFSPHKGFYSPQGVGVLLKSDKINLSPILFGGTGTNSLELHQPNFSPEKYESGTICTPAILGFGAGVDFVEENFVNIKEKMEDLTTYLHYEFSKLPIEIYTSTENANGVFAFNIPNMNSNEVATYLNDKYEICVRGGYHCAPFKHKALGTIEQGAVRVSFSIANTFQEVERLNLAIKHLLKLRKII